MIEIQSYKLRFSYIEARLGGSRCCEDGREELKRTQLQKRLQGFILGGSFLEQQGTLAEESAAQRELCFWVSYEVVD